MNYRVYLKKYEVLRKEAERDLSLGMYNKAVSGFWFSIEALLRYLIMKSGKTPPERAGPLISKFINELIYKLDAKKKLRELLNGLYIKRREVDHRRKIADEAYAVRAYSKYREIIEIIEKNVSF